jgi:hypothetical protein
MVRLALVGLAVATLAASAHSATIHVPADQPTIQAGINAAAAGDTVEVACGTYYEHDIVLMSGVTVRSATVQPGCVVIDAQHLGRIFFLDKVTGAAVRGITLTGGDPNFDHGGAVIAYTSSVTFDDCHFLNNQTIYEGGAIAVNTSSVTLTGCLLAGNSAGNTGGALNGWTSSYSLDGCTLVGNTSGAQGGAICGLALDTILVSASILWGNVAAAGHEVDVRTSSAISLVCADVDTSGTWRSGAGSVTWGPLLSADPLFCDPSAANYYLRSDSPCTAPNSDGCGLIGALDVGCGPVAMTPETWARIKAGYR